MFLRLSLYVSILLSGAIFGFFYAWVCSTMWGLDMLPPELAIKAMNAMNLSVRNPVFFPIFFLTPVACILAAAIAFHGRLKKVAWLMAAAAMVYFAGAFVPTALVNVPMNEALAEAFYTHETAPTVWQDYSSNWQFWNQIRTLMAGLCLLLIATALLSMGASSQQIKPE